MQNPPVTSHGPSQGASDGASRSPSANQGRPSDPTPLVTAPAAVPSPISRRPAVVPSPIGRRPAIVIALAGVAAVIVAGFLVRSSTAEIAVSIWLDAHHTPALDVVARALSSAFEAPGAVLVGVVLAVVVAWRRRSVVEGLHAGLALGLAWGSSYLVKLLVARPRPDWALLHHHVMAAETDPGFPSGHATYTAALVTVALLCTSRGRRAPVAVVGVVLALAVDGSRLYLGFHYPSDVVAGIVYGVAAAFLMFVTLATAVRHTRLERHIGPRNPATALPPGTH